MKMLIKTQQIRQRKLVRAAEALGLNWLIEGVTLQQKEAKSIAVHV